MKSRTFYSAIAAISGLLLFVGIIGFWGLTVNNPRALITSGGQTAPAAAQFVPRQAPLMVSLLARPDQLWQLRQTFTAPEQRFTARKEWQSLVNTLQDSVGWDYDTDLRPWIGQEATFAVTAADLDYDSSNGQQPGYLFVLSCRDIQKAREALHLLWQQRISLGRNLTFETISGIPLIYDQVSAKRGVDRRRGSREDPLSLTETLASAVVSDRYVLLANEPTVLRQAISTYRAPDVSLAKASRYREAMHTLDANRIGWVHANVPNLLAWLGLETVEESSRLELGKRASDVFMSLRVLPTGLLADTATMPAPGMSFPASSTTMGSVPQGMLGLLPSESPFVSSGTDLPQLLLSINENIGSYAVTQRSLDLFLKAISLPGEVSAELARQLQGQYAVAALLEPEPSWLLIMPAMDESGFSEIDRLVQQQGVTVSHTNLDGQDVTAWTKLSLSRRSPKGAIGLQTQVMGVHTDVDGYDVFATTLSGLQQVFNSQEDGALSQSPAFTELMESLKTPTGTLTYINWPRLAPVVYRQFPWLRLIEQGGQPLTPHIGPLVAEGLGSSNSSQRGTIAIKLLENL